jgi:SAM-dependent methyltransferase
MSHIQAEKRWDNVYSSGMKYHAEPPLQFVDTIIKQVDHYDLASGKGLYIGCGNGRNFIPLSTAGLDIIGLDISQVALNQLLIKNRKLSTKLKHSDFLGFDSSDVYNYIISIQVFQHGTWDDIQKLFTKVHKLLSPGGLFFLRVRSIDMNIENIHRVVEKTPFGGFTVCFKEGSKKDLNIHYYSIDELIFLTRNKYKNIITPVEITSASHEKTTSHIEAVWMKI